MTWRGPDTLADLLRPVGDLVLLPGNPRRGDVDQIADSLTRFGQLKPIVVDDDGVILAGNHTYQAAVTLGWSEVAAVTADDLEGQEKTAFALADNRLSDLATYDDELLRDLLAEVDDFTGIGYTEDDLELLSARIEDVADTEPDPPAVEDEDHGVKAGDVWHLGRHRVVVGDCRSAETWSDIGDANVIVTSPPYAQQRDYDAESGFEPIPPDEYVDWWEPLQAIMADHLQPDGSLFVNLKPSASSLDTEMYVFDLVLAHVRLWGWHFATEFCWERPGVPKAPALRFKNQFEPVYQFTRGRWKFRPDNVRHHSNNVPIPGGPGAGNTNWKTMQGMDGSVRFGKAAGEFNRRTGIKGYTSTQKHQGQRYESSPAMEGLAYPGNRLPTFSGTHEAVGHPAAFPVGLPLFFIDAYSDPGDLIVDPFLGSGSTILAAEQSDRIAVGVEMSPVYVNQTINRWNAHHPDQRAHR